MLRVLLYFSSLPLVAALVPVASAENAADPIQEFAGEWNLAGSSTSIMIFPNHIVQHSRWGRGDIKWDNAEYYVISYRSRQMFCHYAIRMYSETELSVIRVEQTDPPECDLGDLRRAAQSSGVRKRSQKQDSPPENSGGKHAKEGGSDKASGESTSGRPPSESSGEDLRKETQSLAPAKSTGTPHKPGDTIQDCDECPEVIGIPGGSFAMGSPDSETGHSADEGPVHLVEIKEFDLGRFPVTRKQFAAFVAAAGYKYANSCRIVEGKKLEDRPGFSFLNPGIYQDDKHPAVCVSWYDALAYVSWLSKKTGKHYRLPSEAEREYAARAGTSTPYYSGTSISSAIANFDSGVTAISAGIAPGKGTLPVESFWPNTFGLYQMQGNVAEWTQDCWNPSYDAASSKGEAAKTGDCSKRVLRGGAWGYASFRLRSAYREAVPANHRYFHVGFRVARARDG
jgi:formylglycine-generating enzyme required for sulfatase activity